MGLLAETACDCQRRCRIATNMIKFAYRSAYSIQPCSNTTVLSGAALSSLEMSAPPPNLMVSRCQVSRFQSPLLMAIDGDCITLAAGLLLFYLSLLRHPLSGIHCRTTLIVSVSASSFRRRLNTFQPQHFFCNQHRTEHLSHVTVKCNYSRDYRCEFHNIETYHRIASRVAIMCVLYTAVVYTVIYTTILLSPNQL